jgi:hypothetical protein
VGRFLIPFSYFRAPGVASSSSLCNLILPVRVMIVGACASLPSVSDRHFLQLKQWTETGMRPAPHFSADAAGAILLECFRFGIIKPPTTL